jgi:phosphatidylglycerophosphatase C
MKQHDGNYAVFDLDKTLLSADSTAVWMRVLLQASPVRMLAALVALVPALLLLKPASTRGIGASMLLWIATFGLDEAALKKNIDAFVKRFEEGTRALRWFDDAIVKVREHMAEGHRVVVVTAAPQWLAERLVVAIHCDVQVIGSTLQRTASGWVIKRHCRGQEKCTMLAEAGHGDAWRWAYSDSDEDAPMLARAQEAFLINASERTQRRAADRGVGHAVVLCWN